MIKLTNFISPIEVMVFINHAGPEVEVEVESGKQLVELVYLLRITDSRSILWGGLR